MGLSEKKKDGINVSYYQKDFISNQWFSTGMWYLSPGWVQNCSIPIANTQEIMQSLCSAICIFYHLEDSLDNTASNYLCVMSLCTDISHYGTPANHYESSCRQLPQTGQPLYTTGWMGLLRGKGHISQTVYQLIIQILWKFFLL